VASVACQAWSGRFDEEDDGSNASGEGGLRALPSAPSTSTAGRMRYAGTAHLKASSLFADGSDRHHHTVVTNLDPPTLKGCRGLPAQAGHGHRLMARVHCYRVGDIVVVAGMTLCHPQDRLMVRFRMDGAEHVEYLAAIE